MSASPVPPLPHRLFEQHARAAPQATAVRDGDAALSYAALNGRASRLAARLRAAGIGRGDLVALRLPRSAMAVAAMLGILKAGAAYVPIDPGHPADWQAAILDDARPAASVGDAGGAAGSVDPGWWQADGDDEDGAAADVVPEDLMYVIYTSGSTGAPKGVQVTHGNVARLFPAVGAHLRFGAADVWTQFHSPAFGFSVWELWGALAHGGCLVVVPPALTLAPARLLGLLAREGVTVLSQTPTAFRQLARALPGAPALPALRLVAFSGEPLEAHVLAPWLAHFGDERPLLANLYALTETAGEIAWHRVTRADLDPGRSGLIGVPLPDVRLHLLDAAGRPVPDGETGELHVGGPMVAPGYLRRPALTAERFVQITVDGAAERVYRTGDLASRLPGGELRFAGRADRQLKVRGYRVEPGAVEAALCLHPAVADAVVAPEAGADGQARLVAWVLPRAAGPLPPDLPAFAAARLPHYAVPERFAAVDALPMTPNGKLDLAALQQRAAADDDAPAHAPAHAPADAAATLAAIWCELLQRPQVAPADDFFDLGGHSLLTLTLVLQIEQQLGVELTMTDVFEAPTLAQQTALVRQRQRSAPAPAAAAPADEASPHGVHMRTAIAKAREAMAAGQPPYAACIVKDGQLVAAAHNAIWQHTDATAHAEIEAIREACRRLGTVDLAGCVLVSTAEPCSMCLTASLWAGIGTIAYAVDMEDERRFGLAAPTVPVRTMLQWLDRPITVLPGLLRDEMRAVLEDWLRIQALGA